MDPPTIGDILAALALIISIEGLRRTPQKKGKHRKQKRYRRGKRHQ